MTERSEEATAFLDACGSVPARAVSACPGWTAHEVAAHLAAAAAEVTRHLEPYLRGEPVPATRTFEERELPYRAMGHAGLLERLDVEESAMRDAIDRVLAREPDAVVPWTGRRMAVAAFPTHLRNEFAIHRWDIVGDDDPGLELLGRPELTKHAVGQLGAILLRRGAEHDPEPGESLDVRLRAGDRPDVRIVVGDGQPRMELAEQAGEPGVELDPASRVLVLWGRHPRRGRYRSLLDQRTLARLQALLAGY